MKQISCGKSFSSDKIYLQSKLRILIFRHEPRRTADTEMRQIHIIRSGCRTGIRLFGRGDTAKIVRSSFQSQAICCAVFRLNYVIFYV